MSMKSNILIIEKEYTPRKLNVFFLNVLVYYASKKILFLINTHVIKNREKFRGSEHFFWVYILNTRQANELRIVHKKSPGNPFFSLF